MKLYFQHSDGSMSFIKETVHGKFVNDALEDLKKRNPKFISYYQRIWMDDKGWIWIDVGSWSEYYIVKEP